MKYRIGWLIVFFLTAVTFACSPGAVQPQRPGFIATDLAQISNIYEAAIAPREPD